MARYDEKSGAPRVTAPEAAAVIDELSKLISSPPEALTALLGAADLQSLARRKETFSTEQLLPIIRIAHRYKLLKLIPAHGIPSFNFDLAEGVNLEGGPLGSDLSAPDYELSCRRFKLAGFDVDFPLCLPASIISANSSWLKFYAELGFSILTYKTVRSREKLPHEWPNWVFLHDSTKLKAQNEIGMTGERGYMPDDLTRASMANSFGVPSLKPEWWENDVAKAAKFIQKGQVLIVSVVASDASSDQATEDDFVWTARRAKKAGAQIIELNYSCPNTQGEGRLGEVYQNPELSARFSSAVKKAVGDTPLFVKIGYLNAADLRCFVEANIGFIDGITAINTMQCEVRESPSDEFPTGKQLFPGERRLPAGVSGWAISDAAYEVATNLVALRDKLGASKRRFAIISLGGVLTKSDFEARLATGVDAVGICTGAYLNANIGRELRFEGAGHGREAQAGYPHDGPLKDPLPGLKMRQESRAESEELGHPADTSNTGGAIGASSVGALSSPGMEDEMKEKSSICLSAKVVSTRWPGICIVQDCSSETQYAFKLDRIEGYRGEDERELGLVVGQVVKIQAEDDRVVKVKLR